MLPLLPTHFVGFTTTCTFFQLVLIHSCPHKICVIFLITKDQKLKIIINISESGEDFVLPMACMHLQFLIDFQKRLLKMPSNTATCYTYLTRAKEDSNQALLFILILKRKQLIGSKPTGKDNVSAWGQSGNRACKDQKEKRNEKEKKNHAPLQSRCSTTSCELKSYGPRQQSHLNHSTADESSLANQTRLYQNTCYFSFTNFVTLISRAISFLA